MIYDAFIWFAKISFCVCIWVEVWLWQGYQWKKCIAQMLEGETFAGNTLAHVSFKLTNLQKSFATQSET